MPSFAISQFIILLGPLWVSAVFLLLSTGPLLYLIIANPCREGVASPGLDVGFKCRSFGWGRRPEMLRTTAGKPSQDGGRGSFRP